MDLSKHPPSAADIVIPVKVDGLHVGCDCGCFTRVVFSRAFGDDSPDWVMWAQDAYYPVSWGPFRRTINVGVELVLDNPDTVDTLIAALQRIRQTFVEEASHANHI